MVTGGTSGLGLLTGRWIAERGAQAVVFASRGGRLSDGAESEWAHVLASGAAAVVARAPPHDRAVFAILAAYVVAAFVGAFEGASRRGSVPVLARRRPRPRSPAWSER